MAEKTEIAVSEHFVSQNEDERRDNVQRAADEYAALCAQGCCVSGERPDRE